jgi:hypothetical protein
LDCGDLRRFGLRTCRSTPPKKAAATAALQNRFGLRRFPPLWGDHLIVSRFFMGVLLFETQRPRIDANHVWRTGCDCNSPRRRGLASRGGHLGRGWWPTDLATIAGALIPPCAGTYDVRSAKVATWPRYLRAAGQMADCRSPRVGLESPASPHPSAHAGSPG